MAEHTPGPWTATKVPTQIGHSWKFDPVGGCLYVDKRGGVEFRDPATAEANARLIAAAPDLLEALRKMMSHDRGLLAAHFGADGHDHEEEDEAWIAARAAIAKATGDPS